MEQATDVSECGYLIVAELLSYPGFEMFRAFETVWSRSAEQDRRNSAREKVEDLVVFHLFMDPLARRTALVVVWASGQ